MANLHVQFILAIEKLKDTVFFFMSAMILYL